MKILKKDIDSVNPECYSCTILNSTTITVAYAV